MKSKLLGLSLGVLASLPSFAGDLNCKTEGGYPEFQFGVIHDSYSSPNWARNYVWFEGAGIRNLKRYVWVSYNPQTKENFIYDAESGALIELRLAIDNSSRGKVRGFVKNESTGDFFAFERNIVCTSNTKIFQG